MSARRSSLLVATTAIALCCVLTGGAALAEDERSFTFRLDTPPVTAVPQADGFADVQVEGFFRRDAPVGGPDVPLRTVLVALPPGATPRLEVRLAGTRSFRAARPRPVAEVRVAGEAPRSLNERSLRDLEQRTTRHYAAAPEHYEGQDSYPARPAWLGEIGVLRDQRYVEVHLAPVRYDRRQRGLQVDSALEITVHFEGDYATAAPAASADRFEPVYRETFVNYDQGRAFRLRALDGRPAPEAPRSAAALGAGSSGPIRRIRVAAGGPVRLDHARFLAEAPEFLDTDPTHWRVASMGQPVAVHLQQSPMGDPTRLEAGEWLQFYGEALLGEPETVPNYVNPQQPQLALYAANDTTDEGAYFLTIEDAPQPPMAERDATPPPTGTPAASFVDTARVETDAIFWPLEHALQFWAFIGETNGPRTEIVPLPGLASGTAPLQVRVRVRGFSDCPGASPDHHTSVLLRNATLQTLVLPGSNPDNQGNENHGLFDGNTLVVHDFAWTHAGGNPQASDPLSVLVDAEDVAGGCPTGGSLLNQILLDWIEIDYARSFVAAGERLEFEVPDGDALFEVTGFTSGAIEVYEITGAPDALRLTGVEVLPDGPGFKARFRIDDDLTGAPRRFVAASAAGASIPSGASFEADRVSTLIDDTTQADLVVIAHPDLLDSACSAGGNPCSYDADCTASAADRCAVVPGTNLELLLARRATQGVSSRVARIQDVYDEFNFGIAHPDAIRNLLAWLLAGGWNGNPPADVLLLGDGTFDYKGLTAAGNFVPTQIMVKDGANLPTANIFPQYASDSQLAAVAGGDSLADLTVGRISARTLGDAEGILGKILGIEESPGAGSWTESVLFITDRGANDDLNGNEAGMLWTMNDLADSFVGPAPPPNACPGAEPYTTTHLSFWHDYCGGIMANCQFPGSAASNAMRQDIADRVNGLEGDGAAVVQFVGHGNYDLWSNAVIFCVNEDNNSCTQDDTTLLTNLDRSPWLIAHNCLTGGFHSEKSFGEQWLRRLSGGASAVYAPSGLGFQFLGNSIIPVIWGDVFGPHKERRLGVPVMNSQVQLCTQGSIEACQFYVLLGDPTAQLALHTVGPASDVVATPSTGPEAFVELSWTASTTPGAIYDVYRIEVPGQVQYQSIACGLSGTSFMDEGVVQTKTYRYYVVARDQGFASAWSNFNSDCGPTPGPDCVQATPLNLMPPNAPAGVTAMDAETGGSLVVQWTPNVEPDIANYIIHYGTTPALGATLVMFGSSTQGVVTGLQNGALYFVAVQAKNTSGAFSALSDVVIETPNQVLGVKSPDFVDDLRLAKQGTNALLTWGAVTQDIYGKPLVVASYEIYRGTSAQFLPAPGNRIATTATPSYTDPGALAPGGPNYHYLVRALDGAGNPGGLGRQLPRGILDLEIEKSASTPGGLFLIWSPVTTDFDLGPTAIAHYEVWVAAAPFTRADIEAGAAGVTLLFPAASGPAVEIVPPAGNQYYSVLPVDTRGNRSPF